MSDSAWRALNVQSSPTFQRRAGAIAPGRSLSHDDVKIPRGLAFAIEVLEFLPSKFEGAVPIYTSGQRVRLSSPGGFVLTKILG